MQLALFAPHHKREAFFTPYNTGEDGMTQQETTNPILYLERQDQVLKRVPVSRSTWWRWIKEGKAPKPIKLSEKVTVWRSTDIDDFIIRLTSEV